MKWKYKSDLILMYTLVFHLFLKNLGLVQNFKNGTNDEFEPEDFSALLMNGKVVGNLSGENIVNNRGNK